MKDDRRIAADDMAATWACVVIVWRQLQQLRDLNVGTDKIVLTQLLDSLVPGGCNGTNAIADNYVQVVQGRSADNFSVQIDADNPTGGDIFRPFSTVNLTSTSTSTLNDSRHFVF